MAFSSAIVSDFDSLCPHGDDRLLGRTRRGTGETPSVRGSATAHQRPDEHQLRTMSHRLLRSDRPLHFGMSLPLSSGDRAAAPRRRPRLCCHDSVSAPLTAGRCALRFVTPRAFASPSASCRSARAALDPRRVLCRPASSDDDPARTGGDQLRADRHPFRVLEVDQVALVAKRLLNAQLLLSRLS